MRFEIPVVDAEGPIDQPLSIRRHADGAIDFDFYRRRAHRQRLLARRLWLKRNLTALVKMVSSTKANVERMAFRRAPPLSTCCLAATRRECCA